MQIGSAGSVNPSDLLGLSRFLTNTLDNISEFTDAQITALLNLEYDNLQTFILSRILNDWKENTVQGTGVGLINLTASTNNYVFPTGLITLDRMEINYTGDTNGYRKAEIYKISAIDDALANTSNNSSIKGSKANPIVYVRDGYIYIDPIADIDVPSGLKVWATLRKIDLVIGGSGDELTPIFEQAFHEILVYGAAIRYLESNDQEKKAKTLTARMENKKSEMILFYSNREQATRVGVRAFERNCK